MPLQPITFRPGINVEKPLLANEGGWSASQLIRFKDGLPQAIGGWTQWLSTTLGALARAILSWADLNGTVHTAIGLSNDHLLSVSGSTVLDITPTAATTNVAVNFSTVINTPTVTIVDSSGSIPGNAVNIVTPVSVGGLVLQGIYPIATNVGGGTITITAPGNATATVANGGAVPEFSTTSGSSAVSVALAGHGLSIGSQFSVQISTSVGGLTLQGTYLIQSVTDANNFVINAGGSATVTTSAYLNGGNVQLTYYTGTSGAYAAGEYGVGGWGLGTYGNGGSPGPSGAVPIPAPLWTFANWGETLILCPGNAPLFEWSPGAGQSESGVIAAAPSVCGGIFLAMPQLTVVAWGASVDGAQDPLLLSWSTAGDYTVWAPTVTNQAGSYSIPSGSRIVAGIQSPQQAFIFTDIDLYVMNYLGGQNAELAWGFNKIADKCGLVAPRAAAVLGMLTYWLAPGQFMRYVGLVEPIPCPVWDQFWQDLDKSNIAKVFAATNEQFHEVAWFYPSISGNTGECDSYVKYNTLENVWDYGRLVRTAWQDYSAAGAPLAAGTDQLMYQHETGTNANGSPLNWSVGSGAVMISEGDEMMFVDWILPEFQYGLKNQPSTNAPVTATISSYRFPDDSSPLQTQTQTFNSGDQGFDSLRLRGRHLTFQFGGPAFARVGKVRYRGARDGKY